MDFEPTARTRDLLDRLQVFMDEHVYPAEAVYDAQIAASANRHEQPQVMRDLQAKARELGLWNLFMTHGSWGAGLTNLEYAPLMELAGRSIIGPEALNCSAPDTGNMEILAMYGTPEQQEQWLRPLLDCRDPVGLRDDRAGGGQLRRTQHHRDDPCARATSTSSTAASGTPPGSSTRTASWSSSWASPIRTGRRTGSRA